MPEISNNVVAPNPFPEPPLEWDARIIISLALLYLAFLVMTKGFSVETALSMASKKYHISEDVLRKESKDTFSN